MRVVVIGSTGHIGGYLVPRLVRAGHHVAAVSRGDRAPYHPDPAWQSVEQLHTDRAAGDIAGTFAARIAALNPDAVIDLICFTPESARQLVDSLRGTNTLLLHCGSIWVHGHATEVPVTEDAPRNPFGDYGIAKAAIEELLIRESRSAGVPAVVLHPGHITGPAWPAVNPAGNLDLSVWEALAGGGTVTLPNQGLETLHHVHADDVAQAFQRALAVPAAVGESFHITSERALTMRGFAESVARRYGQAARLDFRPFDEFAAGTTAAHARVSWDHVAHSPVMSIAKAQGLLGYRPRFTSLQAVGESLDWLAAGGSLPPARPAPENEIRD